MFEPGADVTRFYTLMKFYFHKKKMFFFFVCFGRSHEAKFAETIFFESLLAETIFLKCFFYFLS